MTIKDIARLSGCAVGTVSRVLNHHPGVSEATRNKVMAVVDAYGFQPNSNAKHLKQRLNSGIAILVKGTHNMLFASMVEPMQAEIAARGYTSFISYLDEDDNEVEAAIQICRERRPYGILFLGSNIEFFQESFEKIAIPCVLVTNSASGLNFPNLSSISTDDEQAAACAVEHLITLGHRKIGILGGRMCSSKASSARFLGVNRAFAQYELPFDEEKYYELARFSMQSGYEAMIRLLTRCPELTAVFAMGDVMALGAIRAVHDLGKRVPEDISVIGFDGIELAEYVQPKITTIKQEEEALAKGGVAILLDQVEHDSAAVHVTVPFRLIPGESVQKQEDAPTGS